MRAVKMLRQLFRPHLLPVLMAALVVLGVGTTGAFAAESLIDFSAIKTDIEPLLKSAVTIAAGLGAVVLAAVLCWKFFKKFLQG